MDEEFVNSDLNKKIPILDAFLRKNNKTYMRKRQLEPPRFHGDGLFGMMMDMGFGGFGGGFGGFGGFGGPSRRRRDYDFYDDEEDMMMMM